MVTCLLEYYSKDSNSAVRAKIVMILADLSRTPGFDVLPLAEDIVRLLSHESKFSVCINMTKSMP